MSAFNQPCEPDSDLEVESFSFNWPDGWPDDLLRWVLDRWIQLLGIGFLLLGVGFLFKYSYDHGLLSPPLRVACGAAIGAALTFAGVKLRGSRHRLARVLLGGASATFYITVFAASELYQLIPGNIAFAGMIGVTMATFVAAVSQRDAILANIATIGGFATPFVLDSPFPTGVESDLGTLVYMVCVLLGATSIYIMRGWRSVVVTSALAMWTFLALSAGNATGLFQQTAIQLAIVLTLLATGVAPVFVAVRNHLARVAARDADGGDDEKTVGLVTASVLASVTPFIALLVSHGVWPTASPLVWFVIGIVLAAIYGCGSVYLERAGASSSGLGIIHGIVSVGLLTMSLTEVLSGSSLMSAIIFEATALCWAGRVLKDRYVGDFDLFGITAPMIVSTLGHGLLALVTLDSVFLLGATASTTFFDAPAMQLFLNVAALIVVGQTHEEGAIRPGFEWAAHILFMLAVIHQAGPVAHGDLIVTASWGVYSIAVIAVGLVTADRSRQWIGVGVLLLSAGKLLFVDMSGAETLWRVLLFMGFGVALLVLNYFSERWTGSDRLDGEIDQSGCRDVSSDMSLP
jgi:uncharacterized membrane protein